LLPARLRVLARAAVLAALGAACWPAAPAYAAVFHSRASALRLAFPAADTVIVHDLLLSDDAARKIEASAGSTLPSRLVSMYVGVKQGTTQGYAFFETHTVRTLPETILVVLDAHGRTSAVHLLAFHEPAEYMPPPRWLQQFAGRGLSEDLRLRGGIAGIAGSTLTAGAVTAAIRRVRAVFEIEVAPTLHEGS
jgi:hypothetical protein